jgi:hypothetical protein
MIIRVRRFTSCFCRTCPIRVPSGDRKKYIGLVIAAFFWLLLCGLLAVEIPLISAHFSVASQANPNQTRTSVGSTDIGITLLIAGLPHSGNATPLLRIGRKTFRNGVGSRKLVFTLTPAEFASINDGDLVVMLWGRVHLFGPLDKNNLEMKEQLRLEKQSALDHLIEVRAEVSDQQDAARLDSAIKQLTDSLQTHRWIDASHVQPAHAMAVFNAESSAVASLQQVATATLAMDMFQTITQIVGVDHSLAWQAIYESHAVGGSQSELDLAQKAALQGEYDFSDRAYASAITHYRDAWQHAENARKLTPTPTPTPTASFSNSRR